MMNSVEIAVPVIAPSPAPTAITFCFLTGTDGLATVASFVSFVIRYEPVKPRRYPPQPDQSSQARNDPGHDKHNTRNNSARPESLNNPLADNKVRQQEQHGANPNPYRPCSPFAQASPTVTYQPS